MQFYDIDENTMINLDNITSVRFDRVQKEKVVVVSVQGETFILRNDKQKEFFKLLVMRGVRPNHQFVSL